MLTRYLLSNKNTFKSNITSSHKRLDAKFDTSSIRSAIGDSESKGLLLSELSEIAKSF